MKLGDWLNQQNLTNAAYGRRIGISKNYVGRLVDGVADPSRRVLALIFASTDGQVTPNDIYDLPEIPAAEAGQHGPEFSSPGVSSLSNDCPAGAKGSPAGSFSAAAGE